MTGTGMVRPEAGGHSPVTDADVLIVGYGPVGQVLSLLLAQRGWRVMAAEQWPEPFAMPRAVTFDGHAARILAAVGVADIIASIGEPSADYVVENGAGRILMSVRLGQAGRHGWPGSTSMYQPGLEAALANRGTAQPGLRLLRGHRVTGLIERGSHVEVVARDVSADRDMTLSARWVVGCDGANSFVRNHIGTTVTDFGFGLDWMACDVTPLRPSDFPAANLQIADPRGPRVAVSAGHGHRRWEFMRLPDEEPGEFGTVESAWRRLAMFGVTPANAALDRHAVYAVRARCADRWRSGRIIIAGDAAHQMPPFAGQGLCSGLRDAANLAWKLDLVLGGRQDAALLDTYERERKPNVGQVIRLSVWLGNLICVLDPAAAAERDAAMLRFADGSGAGAPDLPDNLTCGLLHRGTDGARAEFAGSLVPQARVSSGGKTGWFDEMAGPGFVFLAREDPARLLDRDLRDFLCGLGTRFIRVVPPGGGSGGEDREFRDAEHVYLPWLDSMRALAVLARPDFYVFGTGRDRASVAAMVAGLRACLDPRQEPSKGDRHDISRAAWPDAPAAEQRR